MFKLKWVSILLFISLIIFAGSPNTFANTNNFYFESFVADYYLSKNDQNRSKLDVTENITAVFPDYNQNHGIERAIPTKYNGHPTNPNIVSVTDNNNVPINYSTYKSNDNLVLKIGDANRYVQGVKEYIIKYNLSDVTLNTEGGDEFYWDINGTGWQQIFLSVSAKLTLSPNINSDFSGQIACYSGSLGESAKNCNINSTNNSENTVITVSSTDTIGAGQNITLVAGFNKDTFAPYISPPLTTIQKIMIIIAIITLPIWYFFMPIWLFLKSLLKWLKYGRNAKSNTAIVPQYTPPKNLSVIESDTIINTHMTNKAISATIIDLAVKHYIKIYQTNKNSFNLELIKLPDKLLALEKSVINMLFGQDYTIGKIKTINKDTNFYSQFTNLAKEATSTCIANNYLVDVLKIQKRMNYINILVLVASIITLNPLGLLASIFALIFTNKMPALTQKGAVQKTYIEGLKIYMQVAEAERLKILQSANSTNVDSNQLVHLYEKLLPYAMLYGIEDSWLKQFAHLYNNQPDWYNGDNSFNALAFSSAIHAFGNTTTNSFSAPTSSNSSGFSGGFSGGGGGGGGGGGW